MSIKQLDTNKEKAFLDIELNTLIVNGSSSHQDLVVTGDLQVDQALLIGSPVPFSNYTEQVEINVSFDVDGRVFTTNYIRDVEYLRVGNLVTISIPTIYQLSKALNVENYFLMDDLIPEGFRPSQEKLVNCVTIDNTILTTGAVEISPSGQLAIYRSYDLTLNFTGSSQCGLDKVVITYHV